MTAAESQDPRREAHFNGDPGLCLPCCFFDCFNCETDDGVEPRCCCGRLMWPEREHDREAEDVDV